MPSRETPPTPPVRSSVDPTCPVCGRVQSTAGHPPEVSLRCLKCGAEISPPTVHAEPRQFGRYRLRREIARGGMGIVYEAEDPELSRRVALKILRDSEADPQSIARLHREAASAAQLHHPNIVDVYEVGVLREPTGPPSHFIVMEFVEGRTFAALLLEGKTPRVELLRMIEEVARAVAFAHSKGIVHRDLKPANLLVDLQGRVVLTDFGLAHAESFADRLTRSHTLLGTPHYMAPEQVQGSSPKVDPRTDVYALGVILYETLTGRPPYEGETPVRVYQQILNDEPTRPTQIRRSLEPDLEIVCLRAMEKDPERRYAGAREFADDLGRIRRGEAIQARRPSWTYRIRKIVSRKKGVLLLLTFALATASTGAFLLVGWAARERSFRESRSAAERAFSEKRWEAALIDSERAIAIRKDPALSALAEKCRERIALEKSEIERRWAEAERYRRIEKERIQPLWGKLRDTQQLFYVPTADIEAHLHDLTRDLVELESLAETELDPSHTDLLRLLGIGWYFGGDAPRAEERLLRALDSAPDDGWAHLYLGRIYLERTMAARLGHTGEPIEQAKEWSERALRHLDRESARGVGAGELERTIALAYRAFAVSDAREVARLCEEGLRRFGRQPGCEEFHNLLGGLRGGEDGVRSYTAALAIRPHYPWGLFMRGNQLRTADPSAALNDLTAALRIHPRFATAYATRGLVRKQTNDLDGAIADYTQALRYHPRYALAYYNRGKARRVKGHLADAIADYSAAIQIDPNSASAFINRGEAKSEQDDWAGGIADYTEALRLDPESAIAYYNRGSNRRKLGDLSGAIADYSEALRIHPQDSEAFYNRGIARVHSKDFTEAERDFTQAIDIDPKFAGAYYNRGLMREGRADRKGAAEDFMAALALLPPTTPLRLKAEEALRRVREN